MSNVLICYRNRSDECTLSGGSWSAGLPLDNLKNRDIRLMARSTDALAASTKFTAALAAQRPIRMVALIRSNCSLAATWRVRIYTDSGLTNLVHDSGTLDAWPAGTAAEDIAYFSSDIIHPLVASVVGQYVLVEVSDTGNADGYLEFGRLFVDDGWQPTWNMVEGASIGHDDLSTVMPAPSGKEFFAEREVRRVMRFQLPHLTEDEGARAFDIQRIAKTVNEVLVVWDPDDLADIKRRGLMGRLRQLSPIEYPFYETNSTAYEIQEIL